MVLDLNLKKKFRPLIRFVRIKTDETADVYSALRVYKDENGERKKFKTKLFPMSLMTDDSPVQRTQI